MPTVLRKLAFSQPAVSTFWSSPVSFSQGHQPRACKERVEADSILATVPPDDLRIQQKCHGVEMFFQKPLGDGWEER